MPDLQKCISSNNYHEGCALTLEPNVVLPATHIYAIHRGNTNKDWSTWITLLSTRFGHFLYYEEP